MLLRAFGAFTLLLMFACGGKSAPPQSATTEPVAKTEPAPPAEPAEPDRAEAFLAKIGEFKDQVCACADSACLEKAQKDMMEWAIANMEEMKGLTPTKAQDETADKYSAEMDACKQRIEASSTSDAPALDGDAILKKMEEFKNQVCACKDKACVDSVQKSMMDWAMKNMDSMKDMKPTKAQDEAADKLESQMDACIARIK
jgi:hypothetical protein